MDVPKTPPRATLQRQPRTPRTPQLGDLFDYTPETENHKKRKEAQIKPLYAPITPAKTPLKTWQRQRRNPISERKANGKHLRNVSLLESRLEEAQNEHYALNLPKSLHEVEGAKRCSNLGREADKILSRNSSQRIPEHRASTNDTAERKKGDKPDYMIYTFRGKKLRRKLPREKGVFDDIKPKRLFTKELESQNSEKRSEGNNLR